MIIDGFVEFNSEFSTVDHFQVFLIKSSVYIHYKSSITLDAQHHHQSTNITTSSMPATSMDSCGADPLSLLFQKSGSLPSARFQGKVRIRESNTASPQWEREFIAPDPPSRVAQQLVHRRTADPVQAHEPGPPAGISHNSVWAEEFARRPQARGQAQGMQLRHAESLPASVGKLSPAVPLVSTAFARPRGRCPEGSPDRSPRGYQKPDRDAAEFREAATAILESGANTDSRLANSNFMGLIRDVSKGDVGLAALPGVQIKGLVDFTTGESVGSEYLEIEDKVHPNL